MPKMRQHLKGNDTANSNEVKYKEKQNTLIFKSYSTYIELNTLQRQDV